MRAVDLKDKAVVIWGLGREGKAVASFLRRFNPDMPLVFIDEGDGPDQIDGLDYCHIIRDAHTIASVLARAEVVIKSPGVSLYHPLLDVVRLRDGVITSLLNLWLAEPRKFTAIAVTGTKGKSTTSALLAHTLTALGKKAIVVGNIGVPVTEVNTDDADFIVIEVSSYQAANIAETCDIGVLTSLYPEHLDWHKSLEAYYHDKLNLLAHSQIKIINFEAVATMGDEANDLGESILFNHPSGLHLQDGKIYDQDKLVGGLKNEHLSRAHNMVNVCAVLAVLEHLGITPAAALPLMENFHGLPHRQFELGEKNGIFYVDDSISTTPQSAIAAMEAYAGKPITLIAGGYDRGIDYTPLINYVRQKKICAVLCMGPSGARISQGLEQAGYHDVHSLSTMEEIVTMAQKLTPKGGAILLSPAAPSYGLFKDFVARGKAFAKAAGFVA